MVTFFVDSFTDIYAQLAKNFTNVKSVNGAVNYYKYKVSGHVSVLV